MKILRPGHRYELSNFDQPDSSGQILQFIEKEAKDPADEPYLVNDGTTNEEVLRMLIDRLQILNKKFPCRENAIALTHIETVLLWLIRRTSERLERGVEGKLLP